VEDKKGEGGEGREEEKGERKGGGKGTNKMRYGRRVMKGVWRRGMRRVGERKEGREEEEVVWDKEEGEGRRGEEGGDRGG